MQAEPLGQLFGRQVLRFDGRSIQIEQGGREAVRACPFQPAPAKGAGPSGRPARHQGPHEAFLGCGLDPGEALAGAEAVRRPA
jgi:hypothetical protein